MHLMIMRHGNAEPFAATDAERVLSTKGKSEVKKTLSSNVELFGLSGQLWVSPYVRAQQTAKLLVADYSHLQIETREELVPSGSCQALANALEAQNDQGVERVFLVGHQPLLGDFVQWLGGLAYGQQPVGTAGLVSMEAEVVTFDCGRVLSSFHP